MTRNTNQPTRHSVQRPAARSTRRLPAEAYDRVPRITLTLTDETIWLTRHDDRGKPAATYPVSPSDVGLAFNAFMSSTGLLPENVLFWQSRNGGLRLGVWLPPTRRVITLDTGRRKSKITMPMPGFVFVGESVRYSIWAAFARPQRESDQLTLAPLPNVHYNGAICAGNVQFPVCGPDTIMQAAQLFFESLFNSDLGANKITGRESLPAFLKRLNGAREFPAARLLYACRMGDVLKDDADRMRAATDNRWTVVDHPDEAFVDDDEADDDPNVFMGDGDPEELEHAAE